MRTHIFFLITDAAVLALWSHQVLECTLSLSCLVHYGPLCLLVPPDFEGPILPVFSCSWESVDRWPFSLLPLGLFLAGLCPLCSTLSRLKMPRQSWSKAVLQNLCCRLGTVNNFFGSRFTASGPKNCFDLFSVKIVQLLFVNHF